jgi:hypothetical protein
VFWRIQVCSGEDRTLATSEARGTADHD